MDNDKNAIAKVTVILMLMVFLTTRCFSFPSSRIYKPSSEMEKREFGLSNRKLYPDDVRKFPIQYKSVVVAWPGIIVESTLQKHDNGNEMILLLEHHYYDWIEDFSIQKEKIFLSPRGEGLFQASWSFGEYTDTKKVKKMTDPGNMAIVYGTPEKIEGKIIFIKTTYIRLIDKQWFRTDIIDYGREGEPVTLGKGSPLFKGKTKDNPVEETGNSSTSGPGP